jgi:hypothetical protein
MRRLTFDALLPWTSESLYNWTIRWGVQYLLNTWIAGHSDRAFIPVDQRDAAQRASKSLCSQFCQSCS